MKFVFCLAAITSIITFGCARTIAQDDAMPHTVTLERTDNGFELHRGGSPYFIKGVGGSSRLEQLVEFGGNSIRTWDAEGIGPTLDKAHELGLTVAVGIWIEHERHGFDFDDPEQRATQLDKVRRLVQEHKGHPAVLLWGVGNEVTLGTDDIDKALRSVEACAAIVQELDPDHPVMTVIPEIGQDLAARIARECPSVDVLGINSYAGLASLPQRLTQQGYEGAYIVTEFGPPGHWEVGKAEWGAPFEHPSAAKAEAYEVCYRGGVLAEHPGRCLGSYAFLWGQKQEVTHTWYGMFLPTGESLPTADTMSRLWTGKPRAQRAPDLTKLSLSIDDLRTTPGAEFTATVDVSDPDGDELALEWSIRRESTDEHIGGDRESIPETIGDSVLKTQGKNATLRAPAEPGAYRVFIIARDGDGHAAAANLPFHVD